MFAAPCLKISQIFVLSCYTRPIFKITKVFFFSKTNYSPNKGPFFFFAKTFQNVLFRLALYSDIDHVRQLQLLKSSFLGPKNCCAIKFGVLHKYV